MTTLAHGVLARWWNALWFTPVAAERLALVRISTAAALLGDILLQQLPHYGELFGEHGFMPDGYSDVALLRSWRWTAYFFEVSGTSLILAFIAWIVATTMLGLGLFTRWAAIATWFLTLAMFNRHYHLKNFGDSVLRVTTFLLMFVPSDGALSLDAVRGRRTRARSSRAALAAHHDESMGIPSNRWLALLGGKQLPWGVRLFQLQLCAVYTSTGLSKLVGPWESTWYQGTSLHYALNDFVLGRWSYALLPVPLWVTLPLSYMVLAWEIAFVPLVVWRATRPFALGFGLAFHALTFLLLEVGWFSFYMASWYCAWIPDDWCARLRVEFNRRWARRCATPAVPHRAP